MEQILWKRNNAYYLPAGNAAESSSVNLEIIFNGEHNLGFIYFFSIFGFTVS